MTRISNTCSETYFAILLLKFLPFQLLSLIYLLYLNISYLTFFQILYVPPFNELSSLNASHLSQYLHRPRHLSHHPFLVQLKGLDIKLTHLKKELDESVQWMNDTQTLLNSPMAEATSASSKELGEKKELIQVL